MAAWGLSQGCKARIKLLLAAHRQRLLSTRPLFKLVTRDSQKRPPRDLHLHSCYICSADIKLQLQCTGRSCKSSCVDLPLGNLKLAGSLVPIRNSRLIVAGLEERLHCTKLSCLRRSRNVSEIILLSHVKCTATSNVSFNNPFSRHDDRAILSLIERNTSDKTRVLPCHWVDRPIGESSFISPPPPISESA